MKKATTRYHIESKQQRKVHAEERRLALMMRALKAVHSAASPESMTQKDLERQRAGQELLGRLVTPMIGMRWEPFSLNMTAEGSFSTATAAAIPAAIWVIPVRWPPSSPMSRAGRP